ncbi:Ser/Thr protein phosphatase [Tritrichomonas foetus]|uniref:Serine/threonine-protein phosphatase n=1 Tax=Tritrichomonas foetus TaxID=1144522 RepID=A0A1J4L2Z2_9EUKA|nr:Ser/Thr protein phosphatase [Tritrichomonas foetus]|eukprot:OHT17456.1 Ser/Thr protein phosphatase [Tritrichomonas foetus]
MSERWRAQVDTLWHPSIMNSMPPIDSLPESDDPLDYLVEKFWKGELPTPVEMRYVIKETTKLLSSEPNVLKLKAPFTICGDIHGQFEDMLEIFKISGLPPYTKYLFLGDYVDRGHKSVEVIMLLCALKLKFPDSFYMIRGNHESMNITQIYGFQQEMQVKYRSESLYQEFAPLFNSIPLAAIIDDTVFCVHGGLSQYAMDISVIEKINRFTEIPTSGALCELLWNDPSPDNGRITESSRNAGVRFGGAITNEFCQKNNITLVVRAHQVMKEGVEYFHNKKVLTVFSAPNYEPRIGNKAGILVLDEKLDQHLIKFKSAPPKETVWDYLTNFVY